MDRSSERHCLTRYGDTPSVRSSKCRTEKQSWGFGLGESRFALQTGDSYIRVGMPAPRGLNGAIQMAWFQHAEWMDRDLSLKTKSVQSFASDSGGRWSFSFFTTFSCVMYVCTVRSSYCTITVGK